MADQREREKLAERFFDALRDGDVAGLRALLAADVHLFGDSGGKAPQWGEASSVPRRWRACSPRSFCRSAE